jgi:ATP-dependent Clp protease ATP-binding subunit ClpC
MFEKFSDQARQVMVLAEQEARALNHPYIGTEHLLLGLLRETDGNGGQALRDLDAPIQKALESESGV